MKRKGRILIILLVFFVGTGLVLRYLLTDYTAKLAGEMLINLASEKTEKTYTISYVNVKFYPMDQILVLEDFRMIPTDELKSQSDEYFEIVVPSLFVSIASLKDLYFSKILELNTVSVLKPDLYIHRKRESSKASLTTQTSQLYHRLEQYLAEFSISSFELKKANLHVISSNKHDEKEYMTLTDLSLTLDGFYFDMHADNRKDALKSNSLKLEILHEEFELEDEKHLFIFDSLIYSSNQKTIELHNIRIIPKNGEVIGSYDVSIPLLAISGFDMSQVYFQQDLLLNGIVLNKPEMTINVNVSDQNKEGVKLVTELISSIIEVFYLTEFKVNNGRLNFRANFPEDFVAFVAEDFNLLLKEINIDSSVFVNNLNHLLLDASFSSKHVSGHTAKIDTFNFKNLIISSLENRLFSKEWEVEIKEENSLINLSGQMLLAEDFDVKRALLDQEFSMGLLLFEKPDWQVTIKKTNQEKTVGGLVVNQLVNIKNIKIEDAKINVEINDKQLEIKSFNTEFPFFTGPETGAINWIQYLKETSFDAVGVSGSITSEKATVASVRYNAASNIFLLEGIVNRQNKVKALKIYGLDQEGIMNQRLVFDSLLIAEPLLFHAISNNGVKVDNPFDTIGFYYVKIENATANLTKGDTLLRLNNAIVKLDYDQIELFEISEMIIPTSQLKWKTGQIQTGNLYRASDTTFSISNLSITLGQNNLKGTVKIDKALMEGIHYFPMNEFNVPSRIKLSNPIIDLKINVDQEQNNQAITLPAIELQNGWVNLRLDDKLGTHIHLKNLDFSAENVTNVKLIELLTQADFSADSISFSKGDLSLQAQFSHADKNLTFGRLNFTNGAKQSIQLPSAKIVYQSLDLENNVFVIDTMKLANPYINWYVSSGKSNEIPIDASIQLAHFFLENGDFILENDELNFPFILNDFNVRFDSLDYFTGKAIHDAIPFHLLHFNTNHLSIPIQDSLYMLSIADLSYNGSKSQLVIRDFNYDPILNRYQFVQSFDVQSVWNHSKVEKIQFNNLNLYSLLVDRQLKSTGLVLSGAEMDLYRDKRLPEKPEIYKELPHVFLLKLGYGITVDTIRFKIDKIHYTEQNEGYDDPAVIYFNNLSGKLTNVTNLESKIERNNMILLEASAQLYNEGRINIDGSFYLTNESGNYTLNGTMGSMDLTKLNEMLENVADISIASGKNNSMSFSFKADTSYAIGSMVFLYDDLKLLVFSKDKQAVNSVHKSGFKSFFANAFIVKKRNPHRLKTKKGDIYTERIQHKSIFNYWAKAVLSGTVSSIGARSNKKEIKEINKATLEALSAEGKK